ncbi:efflux RND transporter permease subunit, partial [Myxococcota bacterium]|nr:efflux RND transporter permease subunit [Myxococcota bacterium]
MSLTRSIVSNRHAVWAIAAAAAVFGAMAYVQLPMQLFPDTAPPLVNVLTIYPGASAEDVSQDLGRLLDEEFASVEGVYRVKSTSQDNMSLISVEFVYTRDVDQAALDIQNAISRIRSKLPSSIKEPQVLKFSTSDRPIITVGISAPDLKEARRLAEDVIAPRFQRALGVAAIDVFGGSVRAMTVDVDLEKAKAYRVPLGRIVQIIKSHNITLPAGRLRTERSQTNFRMEARTADAAELARLPVSLPGGGRLLLSDLATIETGTMDDDSYFFIDGERYIALQGYKSEEANTVRVVGRIAAIVDELKVEYPDFKFQIGEESATFA